MKLKETYGRVGRKTEGPEKDRDFTGGPTESTNLDPWEHQPKSEHGLYPGTLHICSR